MPGLLAISGGTVSALTPQSPAPVGNADTIVNSLAPFPNSSVRDQVRAAATTGNIPDYNEPSCVGAGIQSGSYVQAAIGAGLKAVPVIGGVLSSISGLFGAAHAAAVKQEQGILCAEVPGIQQFLRAVDVAMAQGGDPQAATQAMEAAYSTFVSRTAPIFKQCNAACDYRKYVRAAIEYRKQNYALMTARNSAGAQGVLGGVVNAGVQAINSAVGAVTSIVAPSTGSVFSPSLAPASSLIQAGITPASQGTMAALILVGGALLFGVLLLNLSGGNRE